MESSRASSPANASMPASPSALTPRSKVRAMLAALDDDSDGGSVNVPKKPDFLSKPGSHAILEPDLEQEVSNPLDNTDVVDDAEEEEEEVVCKPRGRLAARMLAVRPDTEDDRSRDGEVDTARDRLRKLLAAEANQLPKTSLGERYSESSDGREKPIVSRKRKTRRARETTPKSGVLPIKDSSPGGMFVSPASHKSPGSARDTPSSEDELPANPTANARFLALVEKKRQERVAREAEIHRQKAEKLAERARLSKKHSTLLEDDMVEYSDDDGGQKLTQQARPTRKASKKALEEMHRETQRMSRNMQLAHEARTKKKITKSDLFARFNYKPAGFVEEEVAVQARPTSSSSAPQTDTEVKDTPPTSPISHISDGEKLVDMMDDGQNAYTRDPNNSGINSEEDIPTLNEALSRSIHSSPLPLTTRPDKGKGRALEKPEPLLTDIPAVQTIGVLMELALPQVRPPKVPLRAALASNDSDSDLEIVPNRTPIRKAKESIFDRIPAKQARESNSLHALRMLANVTSPGKQLKGRNAKPSLTATELQMSLQQRARQQAMREREERLQALRDKGVIVQTAEEREREMADMEDLMAKARREGEEIMKREKDAAKRERKFKGEIDPMGESSDDEEWEEEKETFAEQMSGSGSESDGNDEGDASNEEEDDEDDEDAMSMGGEDSGLAKLKPADALIDNEASEGNSAEEEGNFSEQDAAADFINDGDEVSDGAQSDEGDLPTIQARRRTKHFVVSDDEDEQGPYMRFPALPHTESPLPCNGESPKAPPSVLRSATKTFIPGLTVAGPAGLGLTQIFRGTMDDSQIQAFEDSPSTQSQPLHEFDTAQDSLAFLRNLPGPEFPVFAPTMDENTEDIVRDSQTQVSQVPESPLFGAVSQAIHLDFPQSQIHGFDSISQNPSATQFSEFPEPTQDAGFQAISPVKGRFVGLPPSTIDTVILEQTPAPDRDDESPILKKKGKLRRRNEAAVTSDDEQGKASNAHVANEVDEFEISENIFDVMRKASKRKETEPDDFDKKRSGAKEMVQEQAEESEDEYAGLGGASDDESGGEVDAYANEIIDDEGGKDVDERHLAAFYADKERASDEKQVEKLFKDITNGMLRRKRGADYDLSDSDDGGEARRRMRRTQEAHLRKALLEDERIGKIAENPKKMAFLRAIEDRGGDNEMDFLDDLDDAEETTDSQSQSQADAAQKEVLQVSDSQPNSVMGPPKRKLSQDSENEKRLPPALRRTKPAKRPSSLSEIRQSLSSLIEEPNAMILSHESSASDSEQEEDDSGTDTRRKQKNKENRDPFASRRRDNIAVVDRISLKRASSNTVSTTTRLAFTAPSSTSGFKVPALLRRTTTNSSISSGSSTSGVSGTERMAGGFGDESKFVKKAGKNSGVNYFARENERKMKAEESEKRRKEKRWKGAEGRRKVVGGLFGMGKFE